MFINDDHPSFVDKPGPDQVVWRYIDLAKYLSLLQNAALHFARGDQMSDPWEGAYGPMNANLRPYIYSAETIEMMPSLGERHAISRPLIHMNCWHASDVESAAMWEIYQREGRGVAIKSTWARLTSSIRSERRVYGASVKYVDYSSVFISERNAFDPFMHKRSSFSHEREVRLIMATGLTEPSPTHPTDRILTGPEAPVLPVEVDLGKLIESVHLHPGATGWFGAVVVDVTAKYLDGVQIVRSAMDDPLLA